MVDFNSELGAHVMASVGPLWFVAVAGMLLSAVCESARPRPEAGEEKPQVLTLLIAGIASLVTPIMLFVYAFWSILGLEGAAFTQTQLIEFAIAQRFVVMGLLVFLAVVVTLGSIVGWIIRAAAPGFGKTLNIAAAPLAVATLALTALVSWEAVAQFCATAAGPRA
ncbi:MAG: hypothetical protein R3C27_02135 [Hyphomonadaceae bacterium]